MGKPQPVLGTITLDSTPAYHQPIELSWHFTKAPRLPTVGVFCQQSGGVSWEYIAEYPASRELDGSASWILDNSTSSAIPGSLDYTRAADCQAYAWDEWLAKQGKPSAITRQVFFTVAAEPGG